VAKSVQVMKPRPLPSRYYVVGDEIRLVVELRHQFNVEELRVRFVSEGDHHITLIGEPDSTEVIERNKGQGLDWKRSTAALVTLIDVDHAPGEYFPAALVIRTASGQRYQQDLDPNDEGVSGVAFRVVSEVDPPDVRLSLEDSEE
jgi:hypothetical protein